MYQQDWQQLQLLLSAVDKNIATLATTTQANFDVYHAQLAIAKHNNQGALARLRQALSKDPSHGEALLSLASLLWQQTRNESALIYYVRAQALSGFKERALLGQAQLEIDRKQY